MACWFERRGRALRAIGALAFSLSLAVVGAPRPTSAADITVSLDEAKLVKLPDKVATIVIGNPLIVDGAVQAGNQVVLTAKGYGRTNLIALDRAGNVLMEKIIEVEGPSTNVVVVYRGVERESYSCTPDCERRITLGDGPAYFTATIGQTVIRNAEATK